MNTLGGKLQKIAEQVAALSASEEMRARLAMPGHTFFLDEADVLCFERAKGDSRYPYGKNGFNFWAYASGYMHANEGLFSPFLRAAEGQEPNMAFFAGLPSDDGGFDPIPILSVPAAIGSRSSSFRRYAVLGPSAAYYIAEGEGWHFGCRVCVLPDGAVSFSLRSQNRSVAAQAFYLSSYLNPYLRHQLYESGEDRWFKSARALEPSERQGVLGSFVVEVNEDKSREESITHYGIVQRHLELSAGAKLTRQEETTSRYDFVGGSLRSLHSAAALSDGHFAEGRRCCAFTETAIVGDMLHLELPPGATARVDLVFRYTDDADQATALSAAHVCPVSVDAALQELEEHAAAKSERLRVSLAESADPALKPEVFGAFFEHLKNQVEFCSLIKGYVQLSQNSLIGIRDVFQALEGYLFWQPVTAKAKMLEALGFTAPDGRCFRQYSLPTSTGEVGRMDLRPFIDQGCWVISCVTTYVRLTGDQSFLNERCGYHEIVNESGGEVVQSDEKDRVMDHLTRIMDFLLRHRDMDQTGCVRAMYGDWNDALDGLGVSQHADADYGTGVSVMATLQVYQNALEMVELLALDGSDSTRYATAVSELEVSLKKYAVVAEGDERKILHGWGDQRSYAVGSYNDPDGVSRDGLTSNAFWVLSGLLEVDPSMRQPILDAFARLDAKYGVKTFEPFFPEDVKGMGRIGKLPPGTAENAAAYIHATAFAVMALFKMGCAQEAWDQLTKMLPFTAIHDRISHSPFVMPNSYGLNEQKGIDGECMNDWQTGSSNVVLKLLIRYVFGFEPAMKGAWIQPASYIPFRRFDFGITVRGCDVSIRYEHIGRGNRSFLVDGSEEAATADPVMGIDRLWLPHEAFESDRIEIIIRD